MATLYITEYGSYTNLPGSGLQVPDEGSRLADQQVTYTGTAGVSAALNSGTKLVRLATDTNICSVLFGYGTVGTPPTPAAQITNQRLPANLVEYKGVPTNGTGSGNNQIQVKISAITNT